MRILRFWIKPGGCWRAGRSKPIRDCVPACYLEWRKILTLPWRHIAAILVSVNEEGGSASIFFAIRRDIDPRRAGADS